VLVDVATSVKKQTSLHRDAQKLNIEKQLNGRSHKNEKEIARESGSPAAAVDSLSRELCRQEIIIQKNLPGFFWWPNQLDYP
jgi:hypothetical protein